MKKVLIFTIVFSVLFLSCKEEVLDYAVISGVVSNSDSKPIIIYNKRMPIDTISVEQNGNFNDTLRLKPGSYSLASKGNKFNIYIENGYNLNITYDANNSKSTLVFDGIGKEANNYLLNKTKTDEEILGQEPALYLLDEAEYSSKIDSAKGAKYNLLNLASGLSESYKIKEKRNIGYEYLEKVQLYEMYHKGLTKKKDFKASVDFKKVMDTLTYDNEKDFFFSNSYNNLLSTFYYKKAFELFDSGVKDGLGVTTLNIMKENPNEIIRNHLIYDSGKTMITMTDDLDGYYKTFMSISTNEAHKSKITEIYKELKLIDKGSLSPKFKDYENYAGGTSSLDDFKGKYIYIDVWATWCGPCKAEIPFLKKVEQKYHDKRIEFVSISVDMKKDHDKWISMIEKEELGGVQLFSDKSFQSKFISDYKIVGIPKFILIDPEGNIVTPNAPRPSDPKLIELFKENNI